jgi:hypothetical protein
MSHATRSRWHAAVFAAAALTVSGPAALAQQQEPEPAELRRQLQELIRQNAEMQTRMTELQNRLRALEEAQKPPAPPAPPGAPAAVAPTPRDALDAALAEVQRPAAGPVPEPRGGDLLSFRAGSATVRLADVSLVVDVAAGWSSEREDSLRQLQGGDHDPRRRGFTLQQAELGLAGAVDPYFNANAFIVFALDPESGETTVELEEAYATSQSLPWGLQVKAGQYLTEFGQVNPTHPHSWDWLDQPVIATRIFGGDGMRGIGARVGWLTPLPWYSQLIVGVQNAGGETMTSFLANEEVFDERPIGGRPFVDRDISTPGDLLYSARWENSFELDPHTTLKFGFSGAIGPNATGDDRQTRLYGADFKVRWRPADSLRGWPFVLWQSEIIARDYEAAATDELDAQTLRDWGAYTQVLCGFTPGWLAGLRYEFAAGSGDSVGGRDRDPFRDDRQRLSPLLVWQFSEFSRLRLQYNHDWADHLDRGLADSVYLGLEVLIGAHPAHAY